MGNAVVTAVWVLGTFRWTRRWLFALGDKLYPSTPAERVQVASVEVARSVAGGYTVDHLREVILSMRNG